MAYNILVAFLDFELQVKYLNIQLFEHNPNMKHSYGWKAGHLQPVLLLSKPQWEWPTCGHEARTPGHVYPSMLATPPMSKPFVSLALKCTSNKDKSSASTDRCRPMYCNQQMMMNVIMGERGLITSMCGKKKTHFSRTVPFATPAMAQWANLVEIILRKPKNNLVWVRLNAHVRRNWTKMALFSVWKTFVS